MKMNSIASKVCGFALPLFLSVNALSAQEWTRISYVDFGGNSADDPQIRTEALTAEEGTTSLTFSPRQTKTQKYVILKHNETLDWWVTGGDHTNSNDKEKGYFMSVDCPISCDGFDEEDYVCLNYPKQALYSKTITGVEEGYTYKFEAYVANLSHNDTQNQIIGSKIAIGVFNSADSLLYQCEPVLACNSNAEAEALNWQLLGGSFVAPKGVDELTFKIYPINGSQPGAVSNGFDFGIDDISIYVQTLGGKPLSSNNVVLSDGDIQFSEINNTPVNIYSVNGELLKCNVLFKEVSATLPDGLYIVGDKKVLIRHK